MIPAGPGSCASTGSNEVTHFISVCVYVCTHREVVKEGASPYNKE